MVILRAYMQVFRPGTPVPELSVSQQFTCRGKFEYDPFQLGENDTDTTSHSSLVLEIHQDDPNLPMDYAAPHPVPLAREERPSASIAISVRVPL